ncbi:MAG: hypothetical protein ABSF63_10930 [Candidatus Bathyarchaeia archaeon]
MVETYANTRNYALLGIVLIIAIIAIGANSNPVWAQPCNAQLGYPVTAAPQYYGSSIQVTIPVSATCSIYTSQLYVVGNAYTGYNSNLGTANTVLYATYGNSFSGQLQFTLPVSAQTVQFSVSIYNAQSGYYQQYYGGQPLAVASESYVISPTYQSYPSYPTYPTYPTYPSYHSYPSYPSYHYHYYYNGGYYHYSGGYYNNNNNHHCYNSSGCNHR